MCSVRNCASPQVPRLQDSAFKHTKIYSLLLKKSAVWKSRAGMDFQGVLRKLAFFKQHFQKVPTNIYAFILARALRINSLFLVVIYSAKKWGLSERKKEVMSFGKQLEKKIKMGLEIKGTLSKIDCIQIP